MEYVIKELLHPEEDDEANFIYSELDSQRRETRRVEFYPSGMCFAYGGDMGQDEVLDPAPFPEDLRTLNRPRRGGGPGHSPSVVHRGVESGTGAARRLYGDVLLTSLPLRKICFS